MKKIYDVAIVGAGPAGSSLALRLSRLGMDVIVFDKDVFPRKKLCGGGLPAKIFDILPLDINSQITNTVSKVNLSWKLKTDFLGAYDKPLIYTVNRFYFDEFIIHEACRNGAHLHDGESVLECSWDRNFFKIQTEKECMHAHILIGADGANSIVAKALFLNPIDHHHIGLQTQLPFNLINRWSNDFETIFLDWGFAHDSYAWLFPQGEMAAIGVQAPLHNTKKAKTYHLGVVSHFAPVMDGFVLEGHLIPHRLSDSPIAAEKALLVGDAAGLADYWTGEGMYYAFKSSEIAARRIESLFNGKIDTLKEYQLDINNQIMPELSAAYQFSKAFNCFGLLAFNAIRSYGYGWDVFCRLIRGDRTFADAKERLHPLILIRKLSRLFKSKSS